MTIKQSSFTFKVMLSVLLTTITTSHIFTDLSLQAQQECYRDGRDGWKYLEFIFVEQPKHKLEAALTKVQGAILAVGALVLVRSDIVDFVSKCLGQPIASEEKTLEVFRKVKIVDPITKEPTGAVVLDKVKKAPAGINLVSSIAQIAISKVIYDAYASYAQRSVRRATLVNFLSHVESQQAHIPAELVPAFTELAERYNANPKSLTDSDIKETFEIIQHLLEHTFASRYKSETKATDVLGTLKTFSDIGKNFNG